MLRPGRLGPVAVEALAPWLIDVAPWGTPIVQVNWVARDVNALGIYNSYLSSNGLQNAELDYDLVLGGGAWTLEVLGENGNMGIYTVQADGVTLGTIDPYAGAVVWNARQATTFSLVGVGKRRVRLLMATKNAASTSYQGTIQHLQLRRTA